MCQGMSMIADTSAPRGFSPRGDRAGGPEEARRGQLAPVLDYRTAGSAAAGDLAEFRQGGAIESSCLLPPAAIEAEAATSRGRRRMEWNDALALRHSRRSQ